MLSTLFSVTNAMTPRIPDKNAECAAFAARYPRRAGGGIIPPPCEGVTPYRQWCPSHASMLRMIIHFVCAPPAPWRHLREHSLSQAPHLYKLPFPYTRFVKEQRRKISRAKPAKIFAPLTTTKNSIINTRAERFPAPRLNCKTAPLSSQSPPRLLVCTCSHLIYPLADGSLLPPP